ncbi:MAG TPA: hypothetical protein VGQ53_11690 [Chitinophagaceae bacterium]|nr:hypothetical protein [Chitinophagaceae bacterium]
MELFLKSIILWILATVFTSCHSQTIITVFESKQKDSATELKGAKIYILKKQTTNSDFNYTKLNDIDGNIKDTLNIINSISIFEPTNGQFLYYQFLSTFIGEGYNSDGPPILKEFHDILIIKTDKNNIILDAFQYTLEWAERPLQYDLFKSSAKGVVLTNNLDINHLIFKRTYSLRKDSENLNEKGTIKLKP